MFHQYILFLKHWSLISVTKNCAAVESGIVEHCRVLRNKLLLLLVYGPLFETSQEDGGQKSGSSDVLRCQRFGSYTKNAEAAKLQQQYGDRYLKTCIK